MFSAILAIALALAPISLRIDGGSFYMADEVTIRAVLSIPPHPDNRVAALVWDSEDGGAGSSSISFQGDEDRTTYRFAIRLSSGHYVIVGILSRADRTIVRTEPQSIVIVSSVPQ